MLFLVPKQQGMAVTLYYVPKMETILIGYVCAQEGNFRCWFIFMVNHLVAEQSLPCFEGLFLAGNQSLFEATYMYKTVVAWIRSRINTCISNREFRLIKITKSVANSVRHTLRSYQNSVLMGARRCNLGVLSLGRTNALTLRSSEWTWSSGGYFAPKRIS